LALLISGSAAAAPALGSLAAFFPLPWSHYSRLLTVKNALARTFDEAEALRGGWSVSQPASRADLGPVFFGQLPRGICGGCSVASQRHSLQN
jgi:hypothetical protein